MRESMQIMTNRIASMDAKVIEISELVHTQLDKVKGMINQTELKHKEDLESNRRILREELQDTRREITAQVAKESESLKVDLKHDLAVAAEVRVQAEAQISKAMDKVEQLAQERLELLQMEAYDLATNLTLTLNLDP